MVICSDWSGNRSVKVTEAKGTPVPDVKAPMQQHEAQQPEPLRWQHVLPSCPILTCGESSKKLKHTVGYIIYRTFLRTCLWINSKRSPDFRNWEEKPSTGNSLWFGTLCQLKQYSAQKLQGDAEISRSNAKHNGSDELVSTSRRHLHYVSSKFGKPTIVQVVKKKSSIWGT